MIKEFDLWIHDNVMNPAFELVQKWFHWNRFQLIAAGLIAKYVAEVLIVDVLHFLSGDSRWALR